MALTSNADIKRAAAAGPPTRVARWTAVGFAIGSAVHATAFLLMGLGIRAYGPAYPAWRHVVMAIVDASIARLSLRRQAWLFVALPAWMAEQWLVNGFGVFVVVVGAAVVALAWERRRS